MKTHFFRIFGWMRLHTVALGVLLLLAAILPPAPVQGQFSPCCAILSTGLGTINTTLGRVIGGGLSSINGVLTAIQQFEQQVVWPAQAIAQARALVGVTQGIFTQIRNIFNIPISSATLANPRQLETILLSRSPSQIGNTPAAYGAVYGTVPLPPNASPHVRDQIDMTDAVAQDALERAIAIDAIADQELQAADQINSGIQSAAPGSAPIIEAQADAWLVRSHAYTQSALADLMRVRAIDLANSGATMKHGSSGAVGTHQDVNTLLQRQ
jgi:hypothetical protein